MIFLKKQMTKGRKCKTRPRTFVRSRALFQNHSYFLLRGWRGCAVEGVEFGLDFSLNNLNFLNSLNFLNLFNGAAPQPPQQKLMATIRGQSRAPHHWW